MDQIDLGKLFVLDKNMWNHVTVYKQIIIIK